MTKALNFAPISVVIPCYNAYLDLKRAFNSVLDQIVKPSEIILVDDASSDGGKTKDLIAALIIETQKKNLDIKIIPIYLNHNVGPGGARNAGWDRASQPWIAFLDSDDIWDSLKLALQYQILQLNPSVDLLGHKSQFMNRNSSEQVKIIKADSVPLYKIDLKRMLVSNLFPTRSVMLRSDIPLRFPSRMEAEDYSLWLHVIAHGYDARFMDCVLAYTLRPEFSKGGYSGHLWGQEKRELHTLLNFYKEGHINNLIFLFVLTWSLLKFMRRLIMRFNF